MTSLTLAAALQLSVITAGAHTYAEARATNLESGRPLVVLIGADWCPACKTMKDRALPQVEKGGLLDKVAFAYVDADEDSQLARKMMQGGSIPSLSCIAKPPTAGRKSRWSAPNPLERSKPSLKKASTPRSPRIPNSLRRD